MKTGTDAGARSNDRSHPVVTSISRLRGLPAPAYFTPGRINGTERTVFRVCGTLLRIKLEAESDYHLVISDSGGRTMIVESPATQCVGPNNAFTHQLRYMRSVLHSQFPPGDA